MQDPNGHPTPVSETSPASATTVGSRRKRSTPKSTASPAATALGPGNRRKVVKVSRACDSCKAKKLKCSGTVPCDTCSKKKLDCLYQAQYRRGRPPTPPVSVAQSRTETDLGTVEHTRPSGYHPERSRTDGAPSRASPELATAVIEGQFFDPTSNLTFLHRAWKRFSLQKGGSIPNVLTDSERLQPLMSAGDKPFAVGSHQQDALPDRQAALETLALYFEKCVVTYRFLHQPSCTNWLNAVLDNVQNNVPLHSNVGHAKAAAVHSLLAIATLRRQSLAAHVSRGHVQGSALTESDTHFCVASRLTGEETGLPRLESVQARLLQILYLLQTGRMNQAWYLFGSTVPIVSALGLHRRARGGGSPTADYIVAQCRKRTFWVVYTIDKYLAVLFGRPRLVHDDDIDQDYPDRVNDEDMTMQGPAKAEASMEPHIDSLISHAKIARIIDKISREVYSLKSRPKHERLSAAQHFTRQVYEWQEALPPHLGTVRPSSLIPVFRRQAIAMKMAYCHAIMHANRPFLLGQDEQTSAQALQESVRECIAAAHTALETVDAMVSDGSVFYALWWTPYVTICALAVVYVWEIQHKAQSELATEDRSLFALAERCQSHLARTADAYSPSSRYNIILEELRREARQDPSQMMQQQQQGSDVLRSQQQVMASDGSEGLDLSMQIASAMQPGLMQVFQDNFQGPSHLDAMPNSLNDWQATDWLELDSLAFGPFPSAFEDSTDVWMPNV
ncbi:hypothetical protein SEUCBS139899_004870 [Sporothrix eucalyptigena]|uniref:Zn(2)-C6 fungal-type domain-containing protein n=1 Tax=Sporothrix eucalyptigena TaxID=1812306 RepID=A0ABP0CUQ1_9PEZI